MKNIFLALSLLLTVSVFGQKKKTTTTPTQVAAPVATPIEAK